MENSQDHARKHRALINGDNFRSKMQSFDDEKAALLATSPCKAGLKNTSIIWSGSGKRSNRSRRNVWESCKNGSRLIRNWKQPALNRYKPNMRWRCWWLNRLLKQTAENAKNSQSRFQIKLHNKPFSQCSNPSSRCKAWGATVFRNSSWRLARLRRMSRKISQAMAQTVRQLATGNAAPEPGPEARGLPCEVVGSDEEFSFLDSAKWTPMDMKPSRGACQTASQKRCEWRRNVNRTEKVCSVLRLWIWTQLIAVPFYLALSRLGEADNPGSAHATAKLFGDQFETIGLWASNLTSKSEVGLTSLFAQVGECRQMFSESFKKESYPYTSSVSQDIQGTQSHGSIPPACVS